MQIIGFVGKKGVGKNFVASLLEKILKENGNTYVALVAFADPIKKYLEEVLGIDHKLLYGNDTDKEKNTQYLWKNVNPSIRKKFGNPKGRISVRQALQMWGNELNREIWGKDIWVNTLERQINTWKSYNSYKDELNNCPDYVLITDIRFSNEAQIVHKVGGKLWLIDGHQRTQNKKKDTHASENNVDLIKNLDYTIYNGETETADSLREQIKNGLEK